MVILLTVPSPWWSSSSLESSKSFFILEPISDSIIIFTQKPNLFFIHFICAKDWAINMNVLNQIQQTINSALFENNRESSQSLHICIWEAAPKPIIKHRPLSEHRPPTQQSQTTDVESPSPSPNQDPKHNLVWSRIQIHQSSTKHWKLNLNSYPKTTTKQEKILTLSSWNGSKKNRFNEN